VAFHVSAHSPQIGESGGEAVFSQWSQCVCALPSNWGEWRNGSLQPVVVLPSVHARRVGVLDDPWVLKNLVEWQPLRRVLDQHLCTTIDEVLNLNSNFLYETREKLKTSYLRNQILRGR